MRNATAEGTSPNESAKRQARRVFIVDDHAILRNGLSQLIQKSNDITVCGEASTAEEGLAAILSRKPDAAIVDLTLSGSSGLELVKTLKARLPTLPVLVLSMHDESLYAERCLRAGAKGYVMKHEAIDEFLTALRRVLDGKVYLSPRMSDRILDSVATGSAALNRSPLDRLSDRELEIFELIGRGEGASDIARKLHLSVKTVETYQGRLKEKLRLNDASELFQHALRWVQARDQVT